MMESLVPEYGVFGLVRERTGASLPGIVPSNTYPCRDGSVVIGGNSDPIFKRLMNADRPRRSRRTIPRSRATTAACRARRKSTPRSARGSRRAASTKRSRCSNAADVPAGRIYSVADMFTDPQYIARQMLQRFPWQDGREITLPNVTPKLSETPGETRWLGPQLGEHTDEVLQSLGYDPDDIARLRAAKVI